MSDMPAPAAETPVTPPSETIKTVSRVVPPAPRSGGEWLRAGFYFFIGALLACVLAYTLYRTGTAVLSVIQPFVGGLVLALLLDSAVDRLQKRGMSRPGAVGIVFLCLILVVVAVGALLIPVLIDRVGNLYEKGPEYVRQAIERVNAFLKEHPTIGPVTLPQSVDEMTAKAATSAEAWAKAGAGRVAGLLASSVSQTLNTFVTLLISFYILMDIDRLRARLLYLMRPSWRQPFVRAFEDVRSIFAGFLTKLLLLCALYGLCLALMYALLAIFQPGMFQYAIVVGVAGLLLYAVPYVGATSLAAGGFILGWMASGSPLFGIGVLVATVFLNGVFDNVVYPRLVGGGVGLHPVVAVFALILGGSVFGLAGMVLAVPTAASIQVLLYRMFPHLKAPTPPEFLIAQGVAPQDAAPAEETPEGPVSVAEREVPRVILPPPEAPPN